MRERKRRKKKRKKNCACSTKLSRDNERGRRKWQKNKQSQEKNCTVYTNHEGSWQGIEPEKKTRRSSTEGGEIVKVKREIDEIRKIYTPTFKYKGLQGVRTSIFIPVGRLNYRLYRDFEIRSLPSLGNFLLYKIGPLYFLQLLNNASDMGTQGHRKFKKTWNLWS